MCGDKWNMLIFSSIHTHILSLPKTPLCDGDFFTKQPRCLIKHYSESNMVNSGTPPQTDLPRLSAAEYE